MWVEDIARKITTFGAFKGSDAGSELEGFEGGFWGFLFCFVLVKF